ncbi:hypothetical protein HanRHA438_Chr04g0196341 [Helianthus annuus]|nr:hypothetical protein HanRHA438_Chr04g0196341 [Helianthus annuus]
MFPLVEKITVTGGKHFRCYWQDHPILLCLNIVLQGYIHPSFEFFNISLQWCKNGIQTSRNGC